MTFDSCGYNVGVSEVGIIRTCIILYK